MIIRSFVVNPPPSANDSSQLHPSRFMEHTEIVVQLQTLWLLLQSLEGLLFSCTYYMGMLVCLKHDGPYTVVFHYEKWTH